MPTHLILLVLAVVLSLVAGFLEWRTDPPHHPLGHALGWFGIAAGFASFLAP
jgi:uncharacterized membrane protein